MLWASSENIRMNAPSSDQLTEETRLSGWLIEHEDHEHGHRYLHATKYQGKLVGELEWKTNSGTALRFARERDAIEFAWLFPDFCARALITEHVWDR